MPLNKETETNNGVQSYITYWNSPPPNNLDFWFGTYEPGISGWVLFYCTPWASYFLYAVSLVFVAQKEILIIKSLI